MSRKNTSVRFIPVIILILVLAACATTPSAAPTALPTAVPVSTATSLPPTAVPASPTPAATNTPASVSTPAGSTAPWWNNTVFYEIFVRSFYDADGDGKGDFKGLTAKLDYLKDLGISGIWLMPINPSPSYHGYDVTDYYGVNPDYGTMDDFKNFLAEAHKRGIKVIIDFVLNHTSDQHPWFQASRDPTSKYRNWFIWSDTDPGYLGPWSEVVWHENSGGGYYYGIFTAQMPDLNYKNPDVTNEMEKVAQFWLKDIGLDGFRLDAAQHLIEDAKTQANTQATHDWFKQFRTFYKSVNPQTMTVGEVAAASFSIAEYVNKGDQLDLAFDFDQAQNWVSGVTLGDANKLMDTTNFEHSIFPKEQVATFLTNHDQNRVMSLLGDDVNKAKAAATILLTAPGVPFIYYGEEIGMDGQKPDEQIRTPMQWTADKSGGFTTGTPWEFPQADFKTKNVAAESKDPASLLSHYKQLIQIRSQHAALQVGDLVKVDTGSSSVYAIIRSNGSDIILTLINLSDKPVSDYKISVSASALKGNYQVGALLGGGTFAPVAASDSGGIDGYQPLATLPPNANLVLQLTQK